MTSLLRRALLTTIAVAAVATTAQAQPINGNRVHFENAAPAYAAAIVETVNVAALPTVGRDTNRTAGPVTAVGATTGTPTVVVENQNNRQLGRDTGRYRHIHNPATGATLATLY